MRQTKKTETTKCFLNLNKYMLSSEAEFQLKRSKRYGFDYGNLDDQIMEVYLEWAEELFEKGNK